MMSMIVSLIKLGEDIPEDRDKVDRSEGLSFEVHFSEQFFSCLGEHLAGVHVQCIVLKVLQSALQLIHSLQTLQRRIHVTSVPQVL